MSRLILTPSQDQTCLEAVRLPKYRAGQSCHLRPCFSAAFVSGQPVSWKRSHRALHRGVAARGGRGQAESGKLGSMLNVDGQGRASFPAECVDTHILVVANDEMAP